MKKIAVTGHRPNKLGNEYQGRGIYSDSIRKFMRDIVVAEKPDEMISGMALGVDMIFAEIAIELGIKLTASIPCRNQERIWPAASQLKYNKILSYELCTKVMVNDKDYDPKYMLSRNVWMVDQISGPDDKLIAIWNGDTKNSGTGHCVNYAKKMGRTIIIVDPNLLIQGV